MAQVTIDLTIAVTERNWFQRLFDIRTEKEILLSNQLNELLT